MTEQLHISGKIELPGDKSVSHRAVIFTALSNKKSLLKNLSSGEDVNSTVKCLQTIGLNAAYSDDGLLISGNDFQRNSESGKIFELNPGNSGTTLRLLTGLLSGMNFRAVLSGDSSLNKRPMARIASPLRQMGAKIELSANDTAPVALSKHDGLNPIDYKLAVPSAQVKSALILAAAFASGPSQITDPFHTRDHTERMLNLPSANGVISVSPNIDWPSGEFFIPGDISSAAFFAVLTVIAGKGELLIKNVLLNDNRAQYLNVLKRMGADIEIFHKGNSLNEPYGDILINAGKSLRGGMIFDNAAPIIDEIPILSVAALHASEKTGFRGVGELRYKESNRIKAITDNISSMGGKAEFEDETLFVYPLRQKEFKPFRVQTFDDHRIAMSMYIAGLSFAYVPDTDNDQCVNISFPEFFKQIEKIAEMK